MPTAVSLLSSPGGSRSALSGAAEPLSLWAGGEGAPAVGAAAVGTSPAPGGTTPLLGSPGVVVPAPAVVASLSRATAGPADDADAR